MNGKPTIAFGAGQWLTSVSSSILPVNSSYTLIALAQYGGGRGLLGTNVSGFSVGCSSSGSSVVLFATNDYRSAVNASASGVPYSMPVVLSVVYSVETNTLQYFINGTSMGSTSEGPIVAASALLLGCSTAQCWGSGNYGNGYLSELMMFNTSLDEAHRSYYESHMADKYGLAYYLLDDNSDYPTIVIGGPSADNTDSTALQSAITSAVIAGGGTITLMPGVYNITFSVSLWYLSRGLANTVIQGSTSNPSDTRLKVALTMANQPIFGGVSKYPTNNITIRNLWFDLGGDGVSPTTANPPNYASGHGAEGITVTSVSNLLINNCVFDSAFLGRDISVYSGENVTVNNCSITNHVGVDLTLGLPPDWEAIALYNSYNTTFNNVIFDNYSTYTAGIIQVFTVSNLTTISNCQFLNKVTGIEIAITGWDYHIVNNTANSSPAGGCFVYTNGIVNSTIENNIIIGGCTSGSCQQGICAITGDQQSVTIRNNTFVNVSYPLRGPSPKTNVTNFSFIGNTIINPIYYGVTIGYNPPTIMRQVVIANNTFSQLTTVSSKSAALNVVGNPGFDVNVTTTMAIPANLTGPIRVNVSFTGYGVLYPLVYQLVDLDTGAAMETLSIQTVSTSIDHGTLTLSPLLPHPAGVSIVHSARNLPNAGFSGLTISGNQFVGASSSSLISISSVRDVNCTSNTVNGSPVSPQLVGASSVYAGVDVPTSYYVTASLSGTNQSYIDANGNSWYSDQTWFIGGAAGIAGAYTTAAAITGTSDPYLFSSYRTWSAYWGQTARQYMFPLQNGQYAVSLLLIEPSAKSAGSRLMNVSVCNSLLVANLDVYQAAGGKNIAYTLSAPTCSVINNVLYVTLSGQPVICGISVTYTAALSGTSQSNVAVV